MAISTYFNAAYYLQQNPDVMAAGNTADFAWAHYVNHGAAEALTGANVARKPAPWFDIQYYVNNNTDLVTAGLNPFEMFQHFINHGISEGRSPADGINLTAAKLSTYAADNADLQTAFGITDPANLTAQQQLDLANHFYAYGYKEGRPGAPADITDDPTGNTFTLTTGVDSFTGTSNDDVFNAVVSGAAGETLNTGDIINGGAGVDTLKVLGNGVSAQLLQSSNVENVEVRAVTATTISQQLMQGVQQVSSKGSSAALTVNSADLATTYMLDSTVAGQTAGLTVSYAAATGTSDTAKVSINNAGDKTGSSTTTQTIDVSSGNAIEAVTIATSGTNYVTLNAGTAAKSVTVTGAGVNTLTVGTSAGELSFDASAATGKQIVTVAGVSLGDVLKGGKGAADQLNTTVTAVATALPTISGFETLQVGFTAAGTLNASKVTDVSTLTLNDFDTANATVTQLSAGVTAINLQEATLNTNAVSIGYASGSESDVVVNVGATDSTATNVKVDMGNLTVAGNKGGLTIASTGEAANLVDAVTVSDATSLTIKATDRGLTTTTVGAAKATSLTVVADGSDSTDITTGIITANIVGTTTVTADNSADITLGGLYVTGKNSSGADQSTALNVDAKHADSQITISDLNSVTNGTNAVVDTLTVTGAGDVSITANDADIDLPVVDATGLTGSFTLNAANSDIAMTVSLGNAATGETTNVTTGSGADVISGGTGNDTINGGAGADVISGGAGNDVLTGGAGIDTLSGGAGADKFVINQALTANREVITDFTVSQGDVFSLSNGAFGGSAVAGTALVVTDAAGVANLNTNIVVDTLANISGVNQANVRFAYDTTNNNLIFDADGDFSAGSVVIANVTLAGVLVDSNFEMIA